MDLFNRIIGQAKITHARINDDPAWEIDHTNKQLIQHWDFQLNKEEFESIEAHLTFMTGPKGKYPGYIVVRK